MFHGQRQMVEQQKSFGVTARITLTLARIIRLENCYLI